MPRRLRIQSGLLLLLTFACEAPAQEPPRPPPSVRNAPVYAPGVAEYAFASGLRSARLDEAFPPPDGFERVAADDGSFGAWLRGLPLMRARSEVLAFDGRRLTSPSAAIVDIDVGERNLQQCADSAIRLHAEFLWSERRSDELAYHFTSGDEVRFSDWVAGERVVIKGADVQRLRGAPRAETRTTFREWLDVVFMYAGTRSLALDSMAVAPGSVAPGDFFVTPGSPGHAVVVLDVAIGPDGRRVALLGQGFMPAQEFHVIRGDALDGVWFLLPQLADGVLDTPSWRPFHGSEARRFLVGAQ